VRRALLRRLPALSWFYGLHPWDVERLTQNEIGEYLDQLDDYQRQVEEQNNRRG
jgi:hypothetical protein